MKYIVSLPGTLNVVRVEAEDTLWAVIRAFNPTVWTEEDWNRTQEKLKNSIFPLQPVAIFDNGYEALRTREVNQ